MIKHIIYHVLSKEQHGEATIDLSPTAFTPNTVHQNFLDELTNAYKVRAGKGFGRFDSDEDSFPMPKLLQDYLADGNFQRLAERMMNILLNNIQSQPLATGGKVFISNYEDQGRDYMLIAILVDRKVFSAQNWQMNEREILDIEHLKYAGRVDLTAWKAQDLRYISFLKGQGEVSMYFKEFLACNDAIVAKEETKKLVELLEVFSKEKNYDIEQKTIFFSDVKAYLTEMSNNNEPFVVDTFANRVYAEDPQVLKDKLSNLETGVQDGFIPDKTAMKKLVTFVGKTQSWRLSFDRSAINDGYISENNGKIIINNPTKELLEAFE